MIPVEETTPRCSAKEQMVVPPLPSFRHDPQSEMVGFLNFKPVHFPAEITHLNQNCHKDSKQQLQEEQKELKQEQKKQEETLKGLPQKHQEIKQVQHSNC
jgi:hypothetical protein